MYENRSFEPHEGNYTPAELAMKREGFTYYDIHAAIAAGRRERSRVFGHLVRRAATAVRDWVAGGGKTVGA